MSWKLISTGPKDGTLVLLHHKDWHMKMVQGAWDAGERAWRLHGFGCVATQPTDWHPLPDLPEVSP